MQIRRRPSYCPDDEGRLRAGYLEMLGDKEREAVDGHDGTLVGHPGLVTAAMVEFNKSMPMAHQLSFQRRGMRSHRRTSWNRL